MTVTHTTLQKGLIGIVTKKIAIFDWDNTLIPTTQMFTNKSAINSAMTLKQLESIGKMMYQILAKYISLYGAENMFIVTNASSQKWIYFSLHCLNTIYKQKSTSQKISEKRTYFEKISDLLLNQEISIYSAHQLYSERFPNQTTLWKSLVFTQIVTDRFICDCDRLSSNDTTKYSILSIGDSMDEFNASLNAKNMLITTYKMNPNNILLHRIKLKYSPTMKEFKNEMKLILSLARILNEEISVSQTINYEKEYELFVESGSDLSDL